MTAPVRAEAEFAGQPNQVWHLIFGDHSKRMVELSDAIEAAEDYQTRPDGSPRYTMVLRLGPARVRLTSDYYVFEPPRRSVNRTLGKPFEGDFELTLTPVGNGHNTRVTYHWDVEGSTRLSKLLLPVAAPLLSRVLQKDLSAIARRAQFLA
jgi:hypothetical protein